MAGLVIHQSNHVENLAQALADELSAGWRDPLVPFTIVVQSRGMERWLSIELAGRLGLFANARFPFPNTILQEIFAAVTADTSQSSLFDSDPLTFRLMKTLPACLTEEAFAPLLEYIGEGGDELRLFQLCQKMAGMYDQLTTFRPELIRAWDRGEFDSWHGSLWHRLLSEAERQTHRPALFDRFTACIRQWQGPLPGIPDQLFIFGIPTLPRLHLEALAAVSGHIDVHLFLMNPCQEFWHDIASDKIQVKLTRKTAAGPTDQAGDLYFERGHPLLASLGSLSQEFLNLLEGYNPVGRDLFQPPGSSTLLTALQSQILQLRDPAAAERRQLATADRSIQIHACHSPMREVEALRDTLLRQLEDDPALEPREILVMAPDIEVYAPYIGAVFQGESLEKQKIPFSIADRSRQKESPLAEALLKLLGLKGARLTASQILELLEEPTVRSRFGLGPDDLDLIRRWVSDTHICWGIDAAFKQRFDLPARQTNTWQAGFDRLLLGYALPAEEKALFEGILPYDGVEGSAADVLGRFHTFCERLFQAVENFDQNRRLADWGRFLSRLVEEFFQAEANGELVGLLQQLQQLAQIETISGYAEEVDFDVLHSLLQRQLSLASTAGFLRGGVTFCSLLPMRSIPFKVVALLGMNDAAFPRRSPAVGFDLMAQEPKPGDPSRRKEDRYLFLEAILSARQTLIMTYLGQSVQDNSEAPPSVVVCELIDALSQSFTSANGGDLRDQLVVKHRLQGFNPVYFSGDPRLFSYSRDNYQGARALISDQSAPPDFMQGELTADDTAQPGVTLAQLIGFLQNPARFFLRHRLGISLDDCSTQVQDQEPFQLDGLTGYQISQDLVERYLADEAPAQLFDLYAAKGILPQGSFAAPTFEQCSLAARDFADKVQAFAGGQPAATLAYDQVFDGVRLMGELTGLYPSGLLRHRCATIKPKDQLSTWVDHLAFCSAAAAEERVSHLLGQGSGDLVYDFVADSGQILRQLLRLYRAGQARPLPFFPQAAFSFAEAWRKGLPPEKCRDKARLAWLGSEYYPGECQDQAFDYCFGRLDPIDEEFEQLARSVVEPLLNHQSKA